MRDHHLNYPARLSKVYCLQVHNLKTSIFDDGIDIAVEVKETTDLEICVL